jgi:membrane fusion protein (multidrug efflux system)
MQRSRILIIVAAALVVGLLVYGFVIRHQRLTALERLSQEQAVLPVDIISPKAGPATRLLSLPGTVRAWYEAPIFAQVSGYVRNWYEDYGATVKAGQVLATIDTPGLDADYAAAKARLRVAETKGKLAATTAARWQALAGTPAVSKEEVDVQTAGAAAAKAEVEAAEQDLARYAALEAFKRVVAPFDGVVTARLTDVGAYVNAAGGETGARDKSTELFSVADVHKLRVFVAVPQDYADGLGAGPSATIHLPSQPGKLIQATFLTTARAFNANTRTAVTELTVENPGHALWPGTYVDVVFQVPADPAVPTMPEQALIFRAAGAQVAIVDAQNRVHLRSVTLGQNLGETIQVTSGLSVGDKLVNNPPAGLLEGQVVRPVMPMPGYASAAPVPGKGSAGKDGHASTP